jgi:tellurite methyltransferase
VQRKIVGFHLDDEGAWVAELACRHGQHVRHQPPWVERPWVLTPTGRASQLGRSLACPWCDRAERPEGLEEVRRTELFTEATMPAGLRRAHRVATGTWAELAVEAGRLRLHLAPLGLEVELGPGDRHAIPPDVDHAVEPDGPVRFTLAFFR